MCTEQDNEPNQSDANQNNEQNKYDLAKQYTKSWSRRGVRDTRYLLGRSWFFKKFEFFCNLIEQVIQRNLAGQIEVTNGDFKIHLEALLAKDVNNNI